MTSGRGTLRAGSRMRRRERSLRSWSTLTEALREGRSILSIQALPESTSLSPDQLTSWSGARMVRCWSMRSASLGRCRSAPSREGNEAYLRSSPLTSGVSLRRWPASRAISSSIWCLRTSSHCTRSSAGRSMTTLGSMLSRKRLAERRNSVRYSSSPSGTTLRKSRRSSLRTRVSYSRLRRAKVSPGWSARKALISMTEVVRSRTPAGSVRRWVIDGADSPSRSRQ